MTASTARDGMGYRFEGSDGGRLQFNLEPRRIGAVSGFVVIGSTVFPLHLLVLP